jgi:transcriptional regulator with XRE-family HTH domain
MMDSMSTMKDESGDLADRIAARVRDLRTARRLSLDQLATTSGVSRSMISLIERGESSPTAAVLHKLATALGVVLASLFDSADPAEPATGPLARYEDQPAWRDPESGYLRRNVSPVSAAHAIQIVDVRFPPGRRVTLDAGPRNVVVRQQIWVLDGTIDITHGRIRHRLRKGDCLAMDLDRPTLFVNPTKKVTRYAVVIASDAHARR